MSRKIISVILSFMIYASLSAILGLSLASSAAGSASAGSTPETAVRYVAPGGNCGDAAPCHATIQVAVDAANPGETIKIAAGVYDDLSVRQRADIETTGVVTQVVYITKSLTLQGGYDPSDWSAADPAIHPTVLDARSLGRVIYVSGPIGATIEGLHLTGGVADSDEAFEGGGLYAITATLTLLDSLITDCFAAEGGAIFLHGTQGAELRGNEIASNAAWDEGGGIGVWDATLLTLTDNTIRDNTAESVGGGIQIAVSRKVTLAENRIYGNQAAGDGGGLDFASLESAKLVQNEIHDNAAEGSGGGINAMASGLSMLDNKIFNNSAAGDGGGVRLAGPGMSALHHNEIYDNHADDGSGGGVAIDATNLIRLEHNLIHDNVAYDGGGAYLAAADDGYLGNNAILDNLAIGEGGGIYSSASGHLSLAENRIAGNTAGGPGGGAYILWAIDGMTLTSNLVYSNTAGAEGGGLSVLSSDAISSTSNRITGNTAGGQGGGIYLVNSEGSSLVNDVVVSNRIDGSASGAGLCLDYIRDLRLVHATVSNNSGGDGSGIWIDDSIRHGGPPISSVAITNTIIAGHSVGVHVTTGNRTAIDGVLWHASPITVTKGVTATVSVTLQATGDPAFATDGYHLSCGSAAIDRAPYAASPYDVDGDNRPQGAQADLGADEFALHCSYLPFAWDWKTE